jgi:hypothetical protein
VDRFAGIDHLLGNLVATGDTLPAIFKELCCFTVTCSIS